MGDVVTIGDGEVLVAKFLIGEGLFDTFGDLGKGIGVSGFDIDLLDLNGAGDAI